MQYHNITKDDMLNGDGLRVVLWVAGCGHACPGCHNPITWDENGGLPFDEAAKEEIFTELAKDYVSGVTFSGGDPLYPANREQVGALAREAHARFARAGVRAVGAFNGAAPALARACDLSAGLWQFLGEISLRDRRAGHAGRMVRPDGLLPPPPSGDRMRGEARARLKASERAARSSPTKHGGAMTGSAMPGGETRPSTACHSAPTGCYDGAAPRRI